MKNLELELKRNEEFTKDYTAGHLNIDGQFAFYTLEDEVREPPDDEAEGVERPPVAQWKVPKATAIPRGRYRVILTKSTKFGRILPEILNVPGYSAVRIHAGNTAANTEGCLLVGMNDGNSKDAWLGNSRAAENILVPKIKEAITCGQQVWITITGGGPEC